MWSAILYGSRSIFGEHIIYLGPTRISSNQIIVLNFFC